MIHLIKVRNKTIPVLRYLILFSLCLFLFFNGHSAEKRKPKPLKIGYHFGINRITPEKMEYAKSVGIDYIEVSGMNVLFDRERNLILPENEVIEKFKQIKRATDDAGIKVWSVHMPYGRHIDLSLADETERKGVVELHKQLLEFCQILNPSIILFHPSWHLGLNERELRKEKLIRSVKEINPTIRRMKAKMVIENMLGYELMRSEELETPLFRTVEEAAEIMDRLPKRVYSAIDMNHIKYPEKLILAMGKRLKSVHIADGDGEKECHYFPCSGEGSNNWVAILKALEEVGYRGPFMFESAYDDEKDLVDCYWHLYNKAFSNQ